MKSQPRFLPRLPFPAFALAIVLALGMITQTARAQTYKVIHTFTGSDGIYPTSTLVLDRAGNLYGSTEEGGAYNRGVLFQLKPAGSGWTLHPLHDFGQQADYGFFPLNYGGLTLGPDGALYGSASDGGLPDCFNGQAYCGVVFRLRPPATACTSALCPWDYTLVYQLTNNVEDPEGSLVFDAAGNLYGTTFFGTIYEISPSGGGWNASVIYQLDNDTNAGLVMDNAGNLYGVWADYTSTGGVFELSPSSSGWTETMIYSFTGGSDGGTPLGGLVLDHAGNLYGSTSSGGSGGGGTVFELSPSGSGWTYKLLCSLQGFAQGTALSAKAQCSRLRVPETGGCAAICMTLPKAAAVPTLLPGSHWIRKAFFTARPVPAESLKAAIAVTAAAWCGRSRPNAAISK
jgi:uncharacterized repeat protein (TIGR03803 family)